MAKDPIEYVDILDSAICSNSEVGSLDYKYFTFDSFVEKNKDKCCWPNNQEILYRLEENSLNNGFEEVFINIGGIVLINEKEFWIAVKRSLEICGVYENNNSVPQSIRS